MEDTTVLGASSAERELLTTVTSGPLTKAELEEWGLRMLDMIADVFRAANEEMRYWMRADAEEMRARCEITMKRELEVHRADMRVHRSSCRRS